ncbi:unnamed protein product, partial [Mesorhabditis belari]|uniref:C-type lectin domain-containing protein n=1 Tax=Mesorhabditis belari TaxID=2138241 RepID=A0AAF3F6T5_9BILA
MPQLSLLRQDVIKDEDWNQRTVLLSNASSTSTLEEQNSQLGLIIQKRNDEIRLLRAERETWNRKMAEMEQMLTGKLAETSQLREEKIASDAHREAQFTALRIKILRLEAQLGTQRMNGNIPCAQLQFERENKTAEIAKLRADLNRTTTFLDLDGWLYLEETASWYKALDQEMSFDEAEAYCGGRKSHLVTIHSQEENDFVWKLPETVDSDSLFWIGLKRNWNKENAFEWTDGSSVDFTNWKDPPSTRAKTVSVPCLHCGSCLKKTWSVHLLQHIITHASTRRFRCSKCDTTNHTLAELKRHHIKCRGETIDAIDSKMIEEWR